MKLLGVTLASLGLASAASVSNKQKVSYDDWKVFRVNGPSNTAKFQELVNKLQLDVWKGKPSSGEVVDVSVAPEQLAAFEASTKDFETEIMHNNLGASIADENTFSVYAGKYSSSQDRTSLSGISRCCAQCNLVQLVPLSCRPLPVDHRPRRCVPSKF